MRCDASRHLVLAAVAVAVALLTPAGAAAHDLKASVNPTADPIRVEPGTTTTRPPRPRSVTVTAARRDRGRQRHARRRGTWAFPKPGPGTYTIVVEVTGHRDAVRLEVPEGANPLVYARQHLDRWLGVAIGLALLLGGTLAFVYLRRPHRDEAHRPARVHADRAAGGDRHHRHPDRAAAPRRAEGPRGGGPDEVPEQPEADRAGPAQLRGGATAASRPGTGGRRGPADPTNPQGPLPLVGAWPS